MELIVELLGDPHDRIWPGFSSLPLSGPLRRPAVPQPYSYLHRRVPNLSPAGLDLLGKLLTYDPAKRVTAAEALEDPWFREVPLPKAKAFMPTFPSMHDAGYFARGAGAGGGGGGAGRGAKRARSPAA